MILGGVDDMARNEYDAFTTEYYAQYNSTISSGETRIPICFCIDVSSSMHFLTNKAEDFTYDDGPSYSEDGSDNVRNVTMKPGCEAHYRIDEVKRVLKLMIYRMSLIPILKHSAVVSIVTFSRFADCVVEFSELNNIPNRVIDRITTDADQTNAAKGIKMALERLDSIGKIIKDAGNESYKPVFIFMSDGNPTDGEAARKAGYEVRQRSEDGKLNVIPIAIGMERENETWLRQLSKDSYVYHMEHEDDFDAVFDKIASKINKTATVISVDESLMGKPDFDDNDMEDNTASSKYGTTSSIDEMSDFLRQLGSI